MSFLERQGYAVKGVTFRDWRHSSKRYIFEMSHVAGVLESIAVGTNDWYAAWRTPPRPSVLQS